MPEGVAEGDEFVIEFEGLNLSVQCPSGCGPGDAINIEVDVPDSTSGSPQQVEIIIPDGCFPGMDFTVDYGGRSFDITVPDGCEPGQALLVDVPEAEAGESDATAQAAMALDKAKRLMASSDGAGPSSSAAAAEERDAALSKQLENENPGSWSCPACTYLNDPFDSVCDICGLDGW